MKLHTELDKISVGEPKILDVTPAGDDENFPLTPHETKSIEVKGPIKK